ncbi:hypothetical protein [Halobacterium zhouii]|uniref:hypothetical protein n=1 Tax=Halobacterium zhouii TaxID=2902624 RepID=UPI001E4134AB|nr:hypothetical protein [Halobacterium zhouii]
MVSRRKFLGLSGTTFLGGIAGCTTLLSENTDSQDDCPVFGDREIRCTENVVDSVVVLPSRSTVTPESETIRLTLYNRTDKTFLQVGPWQLRRHTESGEWKRVGPEERSLDAVVLQPSQSTQLTFAFSTDDSGSSPYTIVPPDESRTEYVFFFPGSVGDGPVRNYATRFTAEF